jgi:hypothetical protein
MNVSEFAGGWRTLFSSLPTSANTAGAPSFAFFAKGGWRESVRKGLVHFEDRILLHG